MTKMTKTKTKQKESTIKNLEDLRYAKRKLKLQMRASERKHENSLVNKAVNVVSNFRSDTSFASSKIEDTLNWVGDKASKKYPMNGLSKIIISGLIMVAVPIITSKIQDYIEEKF